MLKINKLTKKFGNFAAVNNISIEINNPGLYIFVGANGSGKTTLFNLICGFLVPGYGEIIFDKKVEKPFGISSEPFNTEPSLTVFEIAEICRKIKKAQTSETEKLLSFWKLQSVKQKAFKALSTGMKKRLSLALSLVGNPNIVFWDEPLNGLDPLGIEILNQLISELLQQKKYIFLSTHLLNEINDKHGNYFVMHEGKIIGSVEQNNSENQIATVLKLLKQN